MRQQAVVDERTLLDAGGHPHTEMMKVTERFRRLDVGHMDLQVSFDDPTIYAKPIVVPVKMELLPDYDLIEYICRENEKDYGHIQGSVSDKKQAVSAELSPNSSARTNARFRTVRVPTRST
jgi:hypothetical protein